MRKYLNNFWVFLLFMFALNLNGLHAQIQSGSSVQITIMGVPSEEKVKVDAIYPVSDAGNVNMPLIGIIRAAGLKPEALAASIQNAYKAAEIYNNPTIQVISTMEGAGVAQQMVHIGGQVRRPGPVPYQQNLTIYQAVQSAGGSTEFGNLKKVKLYRAGKIVIYDLSDPNAMGIPMLPNDTIEVPQRGIF